MVGAMASRIMVAVLSEKKNYSLYSRFFFFFFFVVLWHVQNVITSFIRACVHATRRRHQLLLLLVLLFFSKLNTNDECLSEEKK